MNHLLAHAAAERQGSARSQRARADDSQHVQEPQILADALMNHLLAHAATSRILGVRPLRQIFVAKLAPHAQYLYALGLVRFHHEVVLHARLLARPLLRRAFSLPLVHASIRPYGSGASWNAVCEASTKRPRVKSCQS